MRRPDINPPLLSEQQIKKFWAGVDQRPGKGPQGTCWTWSRYCNRTGYGQFSARRGIGVFKNGRARWRAYLAHRIAFYLTYKRWPVSHVLHHCDNPPCCNPAHLWEGTDKDNCLDKVSKGRQSRTGGAKPGERNGKAKLTDAQVRFIRQAAKDGIKHRELAAQFGVSYTTVTSIVKGYAWKHI